MEETIVIDSHALFWFLTDSPKLSRRAKSSIERAVRIIVPSIVLMEILYILEKHNLSSRFIDFLNELHMRRYSVYPLDIAVVARAFVLQYGLEMHDRIIVATAEMLSAPIITRDTLIRKQYKKTVW